MNTNEDNALDIVRQCLDETLGALVLPIVKDALTRRIVACLAEVQLLAED